MSSIVLSGDTSGSVTVSVPAVSGSNTVTIPAVTGTVMVSSNMPAFSAYANANLTVTNSTATKVLFQVKEWDTNNNFASSTFTPTVAGYYQLNAQISWSVTNNSRNVIYLYKNGTVYKVGNDLSGANNVSLCLSSTVYANGTTDYFEIYCIQITGGSVTLANAQYNTWFNGSMVRSA